MKKKMIIILITILSIITLGIIAFSIFIGLSVFNSSMQIVDNESTNFEKAKEYFNEINYDVDSFKSAYIIEEVEIESTLDGHTIPANYISTNGEKNKDTIIMVHGMGGNRWINYPIAEIFLENGYNVVSYDQRSSGENTAQYTTYGYWESEDLADYVTYVNEHVKGNNEIGIWGTSLGGATTGIYLGKEEANEVIDFAILDSPLSNMKDMLSMEIKIMDTGIPINYMLSMGNAITKIKLGFSYDDVNVTSHIESTTVPLLIINSKADEITPYYMGQSLYKAVTHKNKDIFTVDDSAHTNVFFDYSNEYKEKILQFIK